MRAPQLVLLTLLALSLLAFGASAFPVPSGDSQAFVPPALLFEAGGGLRNPVSPLARELDPTGRARYLQYPPLFPLVLSLLMASPTPRAAFLAIAGLNALNAVLCAPLFARADRGFLGFAAAVAGLATLLVGQQGGRPEALGMVWVLLAAHTYLALPPERSWLPSGVFVGLLGATQPVGGLLLGLLAALAFAARLPTRRALAAVAGTLAVSLAVFAGVLAAGPFGLLETLEGLRRHGAAVAGRGSGGSLATYWIANPGATFYAVPYLLLAGLLAWRVFRGEMAVRSRALFAAVLVPLLAALWRVGVAVPELSYNALLFAPLVFAGNLRLAGDGRPVASAAHGLAAVGYLRSLVLLGVFLTRGVPLEEAREAFLRVPPEARVAVTPSLWVVSEDYGRMTVFPLAEGPPPDAGAVLVQQSYTGWTSPPELPGYRLAENRFAAPSGFLRRARIANTMPGYGYALYVSLKEPGQ
ncbi:MAG TPA: hypothetical protein VHC97_25340 [Thermoanaerobaculia bacterium]|jgi:hypothetical protein|nr:hypothetical protein [Thermoanaerobaculia bacterium]